MVACEIFQYQIIAPFSIMTSISDITIYRKFANWYGPSKFAFNPNRWMKKWLLNLFGLVVLMLSR